MNKTGTQGSDRGLLIKPSYLCVDLYGFILVAEYCSHHVSTFDKDGIFIHSFESSGFSVGHFP